MPGVTIHATFDQEALNVVVDSAKDLNDNPVIFKELSRIATVKRQLEEALAQVSQVESDAKKVIADKASQSDPNWKVIVGPGYKINRKKTGAVYVVTDEAKAQAFFKPPTPPKPSLDTDKIKDYIETESKLPDGIEKNPKRGESITMTVDPEDEK